MKKLMIIGDLHGRNVWKQFGDIAFLLNADDDAAGYEPFVPEYDYYVFDGDYTDSFDITTDDIYNNLVDVIKFKKLYPDNVILLWGNHDVQYALNNPTTPTLKYVCSGFRDLAHFDLHELFTNNIDLFQFAFQVDNYIMTHAGIHKGWYKYNFEGDYKVMVKHYQLDDIGDTLADKLNIAFKYKLDCLFDVGHHRGGYKKVGGPLWLDKKLAIKPIDGYHQIVGHTAIGDMKTVNINDNTSITFIDVLHHKKSFYNLNLK